MQHKALDAHVIESYHGLSGTLVVNEIEPVVIVVETARSILAISTGAISAWPMTCSLIPPQVQTLMTSAGTKAPKNRSMPPTSRWRLTRQREQSQLQI